MEKQKRPAHKPSAGRARVPKVVPLRTDASPRVPGDGPRGTGDGDRSRGPRDGDRSRGPRDGDRSRGLRDGEIVSSSHLAVSAIPELSEFEFGLIVVGNSFERWVARCMAAAGLPGLAPTDVLVLHHVHHRARDKRLADIAFTLNVEDLHVVNYSLKKLLAADVVTTTKLGKEVLYRTNEHGKAFIDRYREIRERCLVAALSSPDGDGATVHETARVLRRLSGIYDQAARAATSL